MAQLLVSNTANQNGSTQCLNLIHVILLNKDANLSHWLKIYYEHYTNLYAQSYAAYTANPTQFQLMFLLGLIAIHGPQVHASLLRLLLALKSSLKSAIKRTFEFRRFQRWKLNVEIPIQMFLRRCRGCSPRSDGKVGAANGAKARAGFYPSPEEWKTLGIFPPLVPHHHHSMCRERL